MSAPHNTREMCTCAPRSVRARVCVCIRVCLHAYVHIHVCVHTCGDPPPAPPAVTPGAEITPVQAEPGMVVKPGERPHAEMAPHLPSLPGPGTPCPTSPRDAVPSSPSTPGLSPAVPGHQRWRVPCQRRSQIPISIRTDSPGARQGTGTEAQRAPSPPSGAPFSPPRPSDQRDTPKAGR